MREGGKEGEREKGREGQPKEGKEGRGGSKAGAVCTRPLGNAALAPPTSVGDCDVTRGTSRLLLPLRANRTARANPGDRVDAGPWAPARPRTNWATAWAPSCCNAIPASSINRSYSPGSNQTRRFSRDSGPQSSVIGPRLDVSPPRL